MARTSTFIASVKDDFFRLGAKNCLANAYFEIRYLNRCLGEIRHIEEYSMGGYSRGLCFNA